MTIIDILLMVIFYEKGRESHKVGLLQSNQDVEESGICFMIISNIECLEKQVPSWKKFRKIQDACVEALFNDPRHHVLNTLPFTLFLGHYCAFCFPGIGGSSE